MAHLSAFDYLRPARGLWLQRAAAFRVPKHLAPAACALAIALCTAAGAIAIERLRLARAQEIEAVSRARWQMSERDVHRAAVQYERVASVIALDRRIRSIAESGEAQARRFADVANHLPPHAWLTSIARDGATIALQGEARNLRMVASVVAALAHAGALARPVLTQAATLSDRTKNSAVRYEIHVEASR